MNDVILTIIVPVYNVKLYLSQCLDSMISNYKEGIEILLVNDGSSDESGEICNNYVEKYEYINVIHKKNGGLSSARNVGIMESQGKYLWFMDSDDYISQGSINHIYNHIKNNKDVIICNYSVFNDKGNCQSYQDFSKEINFNQLPYKYFFGLGNISYMAQRFIVKKDIIINKVMFKEGIYHEDEEWTPRLLCESRSFDIIKESIFHYRIGNSSSIIGMKNKKKIYDKLEIAEKMYNYLLEENVEKEKSEFYKSRILHLYTAALVEACEYSKIERDKLYSIIKKKVFLIRNNKYLKAKIISFIVENMGIRIFLSTLKVKNKIKAIKEKN